MKAPLFSFEGNGSFWFRKGDTYETYNFTCGDCAISIDFGQVIDPKINRHIRQTIEFNSRADN